MQAMLLAEQQWTENVGGPSGLVSAFKISCLETFCLVEAFNNGCILIRWPRSHRRIAIDGDR